MKMWTLGCFACVLPLLAASAAPPSRLTVEQAVAEALKHNPRIGAARQSAMAASSQKKSARGHFLPSVNVSDEVLHYDAPFTFPGFGTIRAVNTNTFVVSAREPILGLLHVGQSYAASSANADAAKAGTRVTEADISEQVRLDFLRYFQSRAAQRIAAASINQLQQQLDLIRAKLKAGVLTRADLLRTQVALANAHQQEIEARLEAEGMREDLLGLIGRSPLDPVELVEPTALESISTPLPTPPVAIGQAMQSRPELARLSHAANAASHAAEAQLFSLFPEVDAVAAYQHISGQRLALPNQTYVGLSLEWPIFSWGARLYAQRSAAHQATAAELTLQGTRNQIASEVMYRLSQAQGAASAVKVAQAAITSAEEAYRVTNALVKAGSATTTDLLDAQSALTQARLNLTRAQYQEAIARVSLARAMGTK